MPDRMTVELPDLPLPMGPALAPQGELPLSGVTVLVVEDSRFASEALRLMCRRLGARLRRAESLQAARLHLRLYRPDVVIVDLGLPDGRGEGLIREISARQPQALVLAMSGESEGRSGALGAGAHGFIEKPLDSLAAFRAQIAWHLPDRFATRDDLGGAEPVPDALALRDDLAHAADLLERGPGDGARDYLVAFVRGVARHARDAALADAAAKPGAEGAEELRNLLRARLAVPNLAFGRAR